MRLSFASVFPPLAALTAAHPPPVYEGFQIKWFDDFAGPAGSFPNEQKWMIINAENYRRNNEAVQLSGGMSLQLNPAGDNGAWYGGRVESYYTLTPAPGKQTIIEASIGWGKNSPTTKVGVWSSFGLLAQSAAHQKYLYSSPEHMELVVLEGDNVGSKASPRAAGILRDQPGTWTGIPTAPRLEFPQNHIPTTWKIVWDRAKSDWREETLTWYLNGIPYYKIVAGEVNKNIAPSWAEITSTPMYLQLSQTMTLTSPVADDVARKTMVVGRGAMMEVHYVAHYESI